jgi:hypothetical protein
MKPGFWDYIRAAFSARPLGMFIPPNWIGLGVLGLLGLIVTPGFLVLGAGLELAYLHVLVHSPRFRHVVDAQLMYDARKQGQSQIEGVVNLLSPDAQQRYRFLEGRCQSILAQQAAAGGGDSEGLRAQSDGLGRLLWIYCKLLLTRQSIERVQRESGGADRDRLPLDKKMANLQERLKNPQLSEELKRSLSGQVDILQQRQEKQREAADKLAFLDSELARIQEQVELIREQAVLTTDPDVVSQRIDQIAATLGGTTKWLSEQQQIYGKVEDLLTEAPPLTVPEAPMATVVPDMPNTRSAAKESQ